MMPEELVPPVEITTGWLNGLREGTLANRLTVDPGTGLSLFRTPFGSYLASSAPPDGWFLVKANLGLGRYTLLSQVESTGGAWTTGLRTVTAYEVNLNASVPSAGTIRVWATARRGSWRFTFGAC